MRRRPSKRHWHPMAKGITWPGRTAYEKALIAYLYPIEKPEKVTP